MRTAQVPSKRTFDNLQETIINYFDSIPPLHRAIILVGGITFFWMLEGSIPLFRFNYNKLRHAMPNFFFTLTTILINFSLAFLLLKSSDWVSNNNFGLIHFYNFPLWIKTILGILLLVVTSCCFEIILHAFHSYRYKDDSTYCKLSTISLLYFCTRREILQQLNVNASLL